MIELIEYPGSNYLASLRLCDKYMVHTRRNTSTDGGVVCWQQLWRIHCVAPGLWNWTD